MKKSKLILSLAAVVFAVAGALATSTTNDVRLAKMPVAEHDDEECEPAGFCDPEASASTCVEQGKNFRFILGETCTGPIVDGLWSAN